MDKNGGFIARLFKGVVFSLLVTVIGILIFAVVVYFCALPDNVNKPVNQFIKIISIFLGVFCSKNNTKGLLFGLLLGIIYGIFTYLLFSGISGKILFSLSMLVDLILSVVVGTISGIICVNVNKEKE